MSGHRGRSGYCAALLLSCLLAPAALAADTSSATASPEARPGSGEKHATQASADLSLSKVGEARLKVLFWSIYDSRLYTPSGDYREGVRPLRLEIEYLRDVKADALVKRTRQEWESMGREHPNQEQWLERLADMWPDIAKSDVLALELDEDDVSTFRHNGDVIGTISDQDFGQQFADIWVSRDSTRPELRLALIGEDD